MQLTISKKLKTDSATGAADGAKRADALSKALKQNERAKGLLAEAADELSSANSVLKVELAERDPPPQVEFAIEKSEAAEEKVQRVSEKLTDVNRVLRDEVRDRVLLEHRFDAITEQEQAARYAAFHDALTGLPNRLLFHDRLDHGLAQASRHGWSLAVMFLDLDNFKEINDTYGHEAGDTVLKTIAERLRENARGDDTISRFGGDEFLYLLMDPGDDQDIRQIAEKIITAIAEPCDLGVPDISVRPIIHTSIGIAIFPRHGITAEELIKCGDAAMYRAKQGKSRCVIAA